MFNALTLSQAFTLFNTDKLTTSHTITSILFTCVFFGLRLHHKGMVTAKAYANTVLPNSLCQLSLWEKTGVPGGNP